MRMVQIAGKDFVCTGEWPVTGEWAGAFPLPLTAADAREAALQHGCSHTAQCTGAMQRTQP